MWHLLFLQLYVSQIPIRGNPSLPHLRIANPHDLIIVGLAGAVRVQLPPDETADTIRWTLEDNVHHSVDNRGIVWQKAASTNIVRIPLMAPRYGLYLLTLRHV